MNFLSIEYFITIAEEGSFTKASDLLFISQQSLSEHIKKLETELGVTLFKRGRSLTLTEAGECFLRGAQNIISARDQMLNEISQLTEQQMNQLTIAVSTFDIPPFLSNLLLEFSKCYPQYKTSIVKRMVRDISTHMQGINLYFSFLPLNDDLEHCYLLEDRLCVAVADSLLDRIYGDRRQEIEIALSETRDLSLLAELPFILLNDKSGLLSQDLEYIFKQYCFTPRVSFQSENADLNFSVCLKGVGAMIGPEDCLRRKPKENYGNVSNPLCFLPIDSKGLKVALALSHEKGKKLTLAEKRFIETTRRFLSAPTE